MTVETGVNVFISTVKTCMKILPKTAGVCHESVHDFKDRCEEI